MTEYDSVLGFFSLLVSVRDAGAGQCSNGCLKHEAVENFSSDRHMVIKDTFSGATF